MPSRSSHSIGEDVRQVALKYTQGSHSSKCLVNMFVTNKASIGTCLGIRLRIVREKEVQRWNNREMSVVLGAQRK